MKDPLFTVRVSDIERSDQHKQWEIPSAWLVEALSETEADNCGTSGRLTARVSKNGGQFLVQGEIFVQVTLPCARSLDPVTYDLKPTLFVVLQQKAPANPGKKLRRQQQAAQKRGSTSQKEDEEVLLTEEDAAFDTFPGEEIELDPFVREQVLLELPMFPLRSDLRSGATPAIRPPSQLPSGEDRVDPRLMPLKEIAEKLKSKKN